MTKQQTYWVRQPDGATALVEGAAERDQWVKVGGYAETTEPAPTDLVHVVHEQGMRGVLAYGAIKDGWDGLGWSVASPPPVADLTKDPQLVDPAPVAVVAGPEKPKTQAASAADKKE
jgi:hypothetical protein